MADLNDLLLQAQRRVNGFVITDILLRTTIGRRIFEDLSEPYIGGHTLEEAVDRALERYLRTGVKVTLDILGEEATTEDEAADYRQAYKTLLDLIVDRKQKHEQKTGRVIDFATVSVKGSSVNPVVDLSYSKRGILFWKKIRVKKTGFYQNPNLLETRVEEIVGYAKLHRMRMPLDMECRIFTQSSLDTAQSLWRRGYHNLSIVLQTRLDRTAGDIEQLFSDEALESYDLPLDIPLRVRLCIGIYPEPKAVAATKKKEMKDRLFAYAIQLIKKGIYVEIATHDLELRSRFDAYFARHNIDPSCYEFQALTGVECVSEHELRGVHLGETHTRYFPVEHKSGKGRPYIIRRLIANPDLVRYGSKALIDRVRRRVGDA